MDKCFDILRLLWLALRAAYEHPATPVVLGLLRDAATFALDAAAAYVLEERVLRRFVAPAPSPAKDGAKILDPTGRHGAEQEEARR